MLFWHSGNGQLIQNRNKYLALSFGNQFEIIYKIECENM